MAPLYLGYAGKGGTVSDMLLEHYQLMASSGVAGGEDEGVEGKIRSTEILKPILII